MVRCRAKTGKEFVSTIQQFVMVAAYLNLKVHVHYMLSDDIAENLEFLRSHWEVFAYSCQFLTCIVCIVLNPYEKIFFLCKVHLEFSFKFLVRIYSDFFF